jgi:RsiW-degrading membrane proteinase PrsW (M82 family)
MEHTYKISFKGEIHPDQKFDKVLKKYATLFKISEAQAEKFFSGQTFILRKKLCIKKATFMKEKLSGIGAICYLLDETLEINKINSSSNKQTVKSHKLDSKSPSLSQRVTSLAGTEDISGFKFSALFSETFKKRGEIEIEDYYSVGTILTTPKIESVAAEFPKPWLFIRLFVLMFLTYLGFVYSFEYWENKKLLPGLIFVGTFAMPLSILVFFFEANIPRNISLIKILKLALQGGILSLILSLIMFELTSELNWLGASVAGIAEEPGKLFALILVANAVRYPYILNGLLFGAAVGCGFGAFESAGYAFEILLSQNYSSMIDNITLRGVLSPFGHIVWTGMIGAALWKVKQGRAFIPSMLFDIAFIRIFLIAMVSHMLWNSGDWIIPWVFKAVAISLVGWIIIISFINEGVNEIKNRNWPLNES